MGIFFLAGIYDRFIESNKQLVSEGIEIGRGGSILSGWVKDSTTEQTYKITIEPINREAYDGEEMGVVSVSGKDRKEVARGSKKG